MNDTLGTLSLILNADVSGLTSGASAASKSLMSFAKQAAGLVGIGLSIKGVWDGVAGALAQGEQFRFQSMQTGAAVQDLVVLKEALDDTGAGGMSASRMIFMFNRNLENLKKTAKGKGVLSQLGIDLKTFKTLGVLDQIEKLKTGLGSIADPGKKANMTQQVFGRGAMFMKGFLDDPNAIKNAREQLGMMPEAIARNAEAFRALKDVMDNTKFQVKGFFTGFAEGLLPVMTSVTSWLEGMAKGAYNVGKAIGKAFSFMVEMFRQGKVTEIIGLSLKIGFGEALNYLWLGLTAIGRPSFWKSIWYGMIGALASLGGEMLKIFMAPVLYMQAAMDKLFGEIFEKLGKIPGMAKVLGQSKDFKADDFNTYLQRREKGSFFLKDAAETSAKQGAEWIKKSKAEWANLQGEMYWGTSDIVDTGAWRKQLGESAKMVMDAVEKDIAKAQALPAKAAAGKTNIESFTQKYAPLALKGSAETYRAELGISKAMDDVRDNTGTTASRLGELNGKMDTMNSNMDLEPVTL